MRFDRSKILIRLTLLNGQSAVPTLEHNSFSERLAGLKRRKAGSPEPVCYEMRHHRRRQAQAAYVHDTTLCVQSVAVSFVVREERRERQGGNGEGGREADFLSSHVGVIERRTDGRTGAAPPPPLPPALLSLLSSAVSPPTDRPTAELSWPGRKEACCSSTHSTAACRNRTRRACVR